MPFVYILRCSDDTLYTGAAKNLEQRLAQHNKGLAAKYTRGRLPVALVYSEQYSTMGQALSREKQIQKYSREQKIELIQDYNTDL